MLIRLVVPICTKEYLGKEYYCRDSFLNKKNRLEILQKSMLFYKNIDLIVTSNNFFGFQTNNEIFLNNLLNTIKKKKDLIIGVDYLKKLNPIGGISSTVSYFKEYQNGYICKKKIWETYPCEKNNAKKRFSLQERVIKIKNKSICLLSCGDILEKCNKGVFPDTDIYIDLAHMNYIPLARKTAGNCSFINKKMNDEKIVVLTQQLNSFTTTKNKSFITAKHKISKLYFENNLYKYLCPKKLKHKIFYLNKFNMLTNSVRNIHYIFIDIEI